METFLTIVGGIVVSTACVAAIVFFFLVASWVWMELDFAAVKIIANRQIVREKCLDPADSLVAKAIREGREPFDEGSRFIQNQYDWLHEQTGLPYPTNYKPRKQK